MGFLEDRQYNNAEAARDYFERALAANPAFTEAYTLYADALNDLGEHLRALEVRREAVERDPLSGFLKSRLAAVLVNMGRIDEAELLLEEIFAMNAEDTYGYEEVGNLRYMQGRLAEAVEAYEFVHRNRPGDPYSAANLAATYALMMDYDKAADWIEAARARGPGNRWELEARHSVAAWRGDWDSVFRTGQLFLAKSGTTWQGEASLGKGDWEAARASFKRTLSGLGYREGDEPDVTGLQALVGLALAEKRLGLESWTEHATAARAYVESVQENSISLGSWPNLNLTYVQAQISAIEGNADQVVAHMQTALDQNILEHTFLENDPFFAEFRDEPRLVAIADEMRGRALDERAKLRPRETLAPT
ncbi:MAG: tetratricopeptide repeat protein [Woeseiaceae bacterium]